MVKTLIFESGRSGYGGSFKCCYLIARNLKESGYSPYVLFLKDSIYRKKLEKNGIESKKFFTNISYKTFEKISRKLKKRIPASARFINFFLDHYSVFHIKRLLPAKKILLVHTNTHFFSDLFVYRAAASLNIPIICHLRSMPKRKLTLPEQKLARYNNSIFIAISNAVLEEWTKAGIPGNKISLIYDAIQKIKHTSCIKQEYLNKDHAAKLLYVGRLKKHKGVDILIKALSILENIKWKLSVVGDGVEMPNLVKLAEKKGLSNKITFYGFQENVERFYNNHDILIVPSIKEEFGLVVLEAMQLGVTVIGSNSGGIPEIIENEKDGLLFESGNIISLRNMIKYTINNPKKRIKIEANGKKKVEKMFSEKYFKERLMGIYEKMLNC